MRIKIWVIGLPDFGIYDLVDKLHICYDNVRNYERTWYGCNCTIVGSYNVSHDIEIYNNHNRIDDYMSIQFDYAILMIRPSNYTHYGYMEQDLHYMIYHILYKLHNEIYNYVVLYDVYTKGCNSTMRLHHHVQTMPIPHHTYYEIDTIDGIFDLWMPIHLLITNKIPYHYTIVIDHTTISE